MLRDRVVSFPPLESTMHLKYIHLQFQLRKQNLIYLTTVEAYCILKFILKLKFTTTFQIHNKNQINIFNKNHN